MLLGITVNSVHFLVTSTNLCNYPSTPNFKKAQVGGREPQGKVGKGVKGDSSPWMGPHDSKVMKLLITFFRH